MIEAALRGDINSSVRSTINKNLATNPFEDEGINLLSEKLIEKALHGKLSLKLLRMVGEYLAIKTLEENGFTNIRPTNQFQPSPNWNGQKKIQFGHVLATWKNRRYVIEIGTRKFTGKNYPFTWVHKSQVKEQVSDEIIDDENRAEEYYLRVKEFYKKAIPAWIAVSIDAREEDSVYSIFFGTAEKINWKLNCKISSSHTDISGKKNPDCFAKDKRIADFIKPTSCDILLITPLEEEFDMLEPAFHTGSQKETDVDVIYHAKSPKSPYKISCFFLGETGPMHAAAKTMSAILYCKPRLVVLIGIGGALAKGLRLGDVVVGKEINLYFADAKAEGTPDYYKLHHSGRTWKTTAKLKKVVQNFRKSNMVLFHRWQDRVAKFLEELKIDRNNYKSFTRTKPIMTFGKIASGDIVGSAKSFSLELSEIDRKFKVIEMEAAGVAEACAEREDVLDFLIIRGISDFADERKSELDNVIINRSSVPTDEPESKSEDDNRGAFRDLAMYSATHYFLSLIQSKLFQNYLPPSR